MSMETLLFLVLVVLAIGLLPAWPYASSWGYAPTGLFAVLVIIFLIWALSTDRPLFRTRSTSQDIKTTVQDAGHDLKSLGRDAADSIRRTVQ
jgi:hypothetical protein